MKRLKLTKEILDLEYTTNKLEILEIANKYKYSYSSVQAKIKGFGIKLRNQYDDIRGNKYGFATPLKWLKSSRNSTHWLCLCDCGKEFETTAKLLKNGSTKSCGCFRKRKTSLDHWQGYEEISRDFWSNIQRGARTREYEFNITEEYAWNLFIKQNRQCALSGLDIVFSRNIKKNKQTVSLDRIDNSKGYIEGNVQWLHKDINKMKNTYSSEHFINLCNQVSDFVRTNKT